MTIPEWTKPAVWGAVVGAVAIAVVAFSAGWIVTTGSAQERADAAVDKAVIAALTPICVAQFNALNAMQQKTHMAALEEESSWQRGDYAEENDWAVLPGRDKANADVAEECSDRLLEAANA
ncbi:MAG: hypothetical protein WD969_05220 [Paracoccaceae bacterium]